MIYYHEIEIEKIIERMTEKKSAMLCCRIIDRYE